MLNYGVGCPISSSLSRRLLQSLDIIPWQPKKLIQTRIRISTKQQTHVARVPCDCEHSAMLQSVCLKYQQHETSMYIIWSCHPWAQRMVIMIKLGCFVFIPIMTLLASVLPSSTRLEMTRFLRRYKRQRYNSLLLWPRNKTKFQKKAAGKTT